MADFTIIETQEQLNEVIGERLKRQEEKIKEQFTGYQSPEEVAKLQSDFEKQIAALQSAAEESKGVTEDLQKQLDEALAGAEKAKLETVRYKVATEFNLPPELAERLQGADEAALRDDAKALSQFAAGSTQLPPFNPETPKGTSKEEALKAMAENLQFD